MRDWLAEADGADGIAISVASAHGWVSVDRDGRSGRVVVRVHRGALRGRGEFEVAAEIRSALLAAARAYTSLHRDRQRRLFGDLPEQIREWGRG